MNLKLKHIAHYLPYELKLMSRYNGIETLTAINSSGTLLTERNDWNNISRYKPILRHRSSLLNVISNNGDVFKPMERLFMDNYTSWDGVSEPSPICILHTENYALGTVEANFLPFWVVRNLLNWKFDVFNLIEPGLAIDVNSLPKNPYK